MRARQQKQVDQQASGRHHCEERDTRQLLYDADNFIKQ